MVLSEIERSFITKEMVEALDSTDLSTIYSIDKDESRKNHEYYKLFYSVPENKERKKASDRRYTRDRYESNIPLDAPATRYSAHRSPLEVEFEPDIRAFFPQLRLLFNFYPRIFYNPLTRGRMEGDVVCLEGNFVIEIHEPPHKTDRRVQIRDLHKKVILEYRGIDLMILDYTMKGNVQYHLEQQWGRILEKRQYGY